MAFARSTSLAAAQELERLQDKLHGLPLPGVQMGPGKHAPGLTSFVGSSIKHPTRNEWATPIGPSVGSALVNASNPLTAAERTTLSVADANKGALPIDWSQ